MRKLLGLIIKTIASVKANGIRATVGKIRQYLAARRVKNVIAVQHYEPCMDVLFINGCPPEQLPHPPRYRVTHQKEQLVANNIIPNEVDSRQLSLDQVRNYRVFIFYRCPYNPLIGEFIRLAKELHKTVLFDVDDLVIDTKYTDLIPYIQAMSQEEKSEYDNGVKRYGKTLALCDGAITTTERLAEELRHYVPEVFINRNTASEAMVKYSEEVLRKKKHLENGAPDLEVKRDGSRSPKTKRDDVRDTQSAGVQIGYFSGSITHNTDIKLILPALTRILKENPAVKLHFVGELDLSEELEPYEAQIVTREFVEWEKLPELIASVDINLAPLEDTIFNEAKSENKWVEAALVKVPTIASNVGAFKRMIQNNETGILCDTADEWYKALCMLIGDAEMRARLAQNAYDFCHKHCITTYTGTSLAKYIRSKMTPNIAFMLPSLDISGGIMVALRHASFLYQHGLDVFIICEIPGNGWIEYEGHRFPVVSRNHHPIYMSLDKAIATMWITVQFLETYPNIKSRYYLVQNFETDFYESDSFLRLQANQTYMPHHEIKFLTISRWCEAWLKDTFEQFPYYAPNGIDSASFRPHRRSMSGRIRVLVEGNCGVYYKNVDESFRVVDRLDPEKYEIWYMSYDAEPKKEYRVDRFLHRVPYEKVFEVYGQCDVLLKSSFLESFSYPPLEMMASGGYAVVVPNEGNQEYLVNGKNCLLYQRGDIEGAVQAIERICRDKELQEKLYQKGIETVQARDWAKIREDILKLYDL